MNKRPRSYKILHLRKGQNKYYKLCNSPLESDSSLGRHRSINHVSEMEKFTDTLEAIRKQYYEKNAKIDSICGLSLFSIIRSKLQQQFKLEAIKSKVNKKDIQEL